MLVALGKPSEALHRRLRRALVHELFYGNTTARRVSCNLLSECILTAAITVLLNFTEATNEQKQARKQNGQL